MDNNSIFARITAGFIVKAAGAAFAIYLAVQVASYVTEVFAKVGTALPL